MGLVWSIISHKEDPSFLMYFSNQTLIGNIKGKLKNLENICTLTPSPFLWIIEFVLKIIQISGEFNVFFIVKKQTNKTSTVLVFL